MEKKIREWLNELPEPYRTKAMKNDGIAWRENPSPYIREDQPSSPFTQDAEERKRHPVYTGFVKYFPDAIAKVARISYGGNEQHKNGEDIFWDRSKSADEPDALMRHLIDWTKSGDVEELGKVAWRAMALLQKELEKDSD